MLYILTGEVQTGKTRWISSLISRLEEVQIPCYGVLTPGIWKQKGSSLEKQGIEALLLPQNQVIPFALRADLVSSEESEANQSSVMGLHWRISEIALQTINEHFYDLQKRAFPLHNTSCTDDFYDVALKTSADVSPLTHVIPDLIRDPEAEQTGLPIKSAMTSENLINNPQVKPIKRGLLIVDELGRLELEGEPGGLVAALELLDKGPSELYKHALIVVRPSLCTEAEARFKESWKDAQILHPSETSRASLLNALA